MTRLSQLSQDYRRVETAICFLADNAHRQPDLAEVAASAGLSEYHFQRLFTRWAGISPKRFLQYLTKENAKALLARDSVLSSAYKAGLSGPARLHDLLIKCEAVTPGEYRSRGAGLEIVYGFHDSPFGECLLALTRRGICFLAFVDGNRKSVLGQLRGDWSNASLHEDATLTSPMVEKIFSARPHSSALPGKQDNLTLHLRGTNFQIKVWEALLQLKPGWTTSYEALAGQIGSVHAARAVGNAVARNPVAFLIPCHRVLQKAGGFGNYHYGPVRKQAILGWELAQADQ